MENIKENFTELEQKIKDFLDSEYFSKNEKYDAIWNIQPIKEKLNKGKFYRDIKSQYFSEKQRIGRTNDHNKIKKNIEELFEEDNSYWYEISINSAFDKSRFIDFYTYGIEIIELPMNDHPINRIHNLVPYLDLRPIKQVLFNIKLWSWLEGEVSELENNSKTVTQSNSKLVWTSNKNALADLFVQLKRMNKITSTNNEIAHFLKNNFTCFESQKTKTIEGYFDENKSQTISPSSKHKLTIVEGKFEEN